MQINSNWWEENFCKSQFGKNVLASKNTSYITWKPSKRGNKFGPEQESGLKASVVVVVWFFFYFVHLEWEKREMGCCGWRTPKLATHSHAIIIHTHTHTYI